MGHSAFFIFCVSVTILDEQRKKNLRDKKYTIETSYVFLVF